MLHSLPSSRTGERRLAFSPDGRVLVAPNKKGGAVWWDLTTGQSHLLETEIDTVTVAFAPDGTSFVTGLAATHVWDPMGHELRQLATGYIMEALYTSDGALLVTAGRDHKVRLWNTRTWALEAQLDGHEATVLDIDISPKGNQLVSASLDGTARIWELPGGAPLAVLSGHVGGAFMAKFSADGARVATSAHDLTLRLWEPARAMVRRPLGEGTRLVAQFTPDGRLAVLAGGGRPPEVFDVATGTRRCVVDGGGDDAANVAWIGLDHDGARFAGAPSSGELGSRVWRTSDCALLATLGPVAPAGVSLVAFLPDERILQGEAGASGVPRIWDLTGRSAPVPLATNLSVRRLCPSPDGERFIVTGPHRPSPGSAATRATPGAIPRGLEVFDARTLERVADLGEVPTIRAFGWRAGRVVLGADDGGVTLLDARTWARLAQRELSNSVMQVAFSPDAETVVALPFGVRFMVLDGRDLHLRGISEGHLEWINSLAFTHDGRFVVSAAEDGTSRLWDPLTRRQVALIHGPMSVVASPVDDLLLGLPASGLAFLRPYDARAPVESELAEVLRCLPYELAGGVLVARSPPADCGAAASTRARR